ncbi:MAG: hypothetical protein HN501_01320 [Waddliaceae bacterium]|nr:hypothetical protein [Waddliaceae bacterium]MBT4445537.1 hypothetical protein [Waddliaceae bacterium]MBT6928402.1 hypothetical protein [Waddliaceae bacterium]
MKANKFIMFFIAMAMIFVVAQSTTLNAITYTTNGKTLDTTGDDEEDVEVYYNPGWVTNTLDERGVWVGNDDFDDLTKNLRIVAQVIVPEGEELPMTSNALRKSVQRLFGEEVFNTEVGFSPKNMLPFLHASLVIVPSGVTYIMTCTVRLVEDVTIKRDSWAQDFTWQAITWEKEKLFISRRGRIEKDVNTALASIIDDFTQQYISDIAMRKEIDDEDAAIESEVEKEQRLLEEQIKEFREDIEQYIEH